MLDIEMNKIKIMLEVQWATKLFECLVVLDSFSCNSRNKMAKNMKKYNLESPVSEVSENIHIYTIIFVCC